MLLRLLFYKKKNMYDFSTLSVCAHTLQFLNHLTELGIKVIPVENMPTP